jgi:hypothetical protein
MAVFEVETPNGTFEIDAPDETALRGAIGQLSGASIPSAAPAQAPAAGPAQAQPSQWDLFKAGLSAIAQDPRKLLQVGPLKGVQEAVQLPRQALEGQLPALPSNYTPEQMGSAVDLASLIVPGAPRGLMSRGPGTARMTAQEAARPVPEAPPVTPRDDMLAQAAKIGINDVPAFLASDSRATQALGQASRQMPFAGGMVEKAVDKFTGDLTAAGKRISGSLTEQTGLDKAGVGEKLRSTFEAAATDISEVNHRAYKGMREVIEPTLPVPEATEPLRTVMSDILSQRMQSGVSKLTPELKPIAALMRRQGGASFEGLQRARARLGKAIDFDKRQGGMEQGDLKQAYGALTDAMERAVRGAAKVEPDAAVATWKAADANFAESTANVKSIAQALKSPSDEALVNQVLGLAGEKTGNAKRLIQLQSDIGAESMQMLGSHVLDQAMGTGETMSAARFSTAMDKLSNTAKSVLFGQNRSNVEALHAVAARMAEQEGKFANRSNTGRAALTGGMVGSFAAHPLAFIGHAAAGAVAGVTLGQVLTRPATARVAVQAARAAERHAINPTLSSRNAFYALQRQLTTAVIREFGDRSATEPSTAAEAPSNPR